MRSADLPYRSYATCWRNNQHSCGLFIDPAEPLSEYKLPEGTCTIIERKPIGEKNNPTTNETFIDYEITLAIKEHKHNATFRIASITHPSMVFVKSESL